MKKAATVKSFPISHLSRRQRRHEAGHYHPGVRLGRFYELRGHGG